VLCCIFHAICQSTLWGRGDQLFSLAVTVDRAVALGLEMCSITSRNFISPFTFRDGPGLPPYPLPVVFRTSGQRCFSGHSRGRLFAVFGSSSAVPQAIATKSNALTNWLCISSEPSAAWSVTALSTNQEDKSRCALVGLLLATIEVFGAKARCNVQSTATQPAEVARIY